MGATGTIGNVALAGCQNCASCVGVQACATFGYDTLNNPITEEGGFIGTSSCVGQSACGGGYGSIGTSSCIGEQACSAARGSTIGDESCLGQWACISQSGTIGDQSCTKGITFTVFAGSCDSNKGIIGDGSCTEPGSCWNAATTSKIGNDSW